MATVFRLQILNVDDDANPPEKSYQVEGIGYDFIPEVLSGVTMPDGTDVNSGAREELIDYWIKTDDRESFIMYVLALDCVTSSTCLPSNLLVSTVRSPPEIVMVQGSPIDPRRRFAVRWLQWFCCRWRSHCNQKAWIH